MGSPLVRVIGKNIVDAKLLAMAPRILAQNRAMVTSMLEYVKAEVQPEMPVVPTRLPQHARDSYRIDVSSGPVKTTGKLWGAVQAYWREYGTLGRFHKGGRATAGMARAAVYAVTVGTGGEPARPITRHALAGARKWITFYYGANKASWWRL